MILGVWLGGNGQHYSGVVCIICLCVYVHMYILL